MPAHERLNLQHLETLLALVESGNFGAAADRLGMAQSTVSQHLKRLEHALGVMLIVRGQRGCRPTRPALRILARAKGLLRLEDDLVRAVTMGALRLGACSNIGVYLLPDLLRGFRAQGGPQPEVLIASNPDVVVRLERAEVDVALMEWWDEREGFAARPWRSEPLVVIAAPGHPLSRLAAVSRAQLAQMALIGGEAGTGTGRLLRAYFDGGPMPTVAMQLGSTEAVKRAVEAGLGVSLVLGCAVRQEVREGRLRALPLEDQPLHKSLRLVWRDDVPEREPLLGYLASVAATPLSRAEA